MPNAAFALTYSSLEDTILQYLERRDPPVLAFFPTAVALAEFEIAQQIKTLGQQQAATARMEPGNPIIQKPARWRKTTSFTLLKGNERKPVFLRKYEFLKAYWPDVSSTDTPLYYADYDYDHWLVAPTPDASYPFEVIFYERLAPLSTQTQVNWLTRNAPNALVYGTLVQYQPFLKNDQRLQVFETKYKEAIDALKNEDVIRIGDRQTAAVDS